VRCPPGAMPHWRAPWAPAVSRPPPSRAPRRPAAPRPAWDVRCAGCVVRRHALRSRAPAQESISDLRQYSLTEEELVRPGRAPARAAGARQRRRRDGEGATDARPVRARACAYQAARRERRTRNIIVVSPPGARCAARRGVRAACAAVVAPGSKAER
jgi:hypothetical protein